LWYALVSKANAGAFAVGTFRSPPRLWDVSVTLITDVSGRPAGAVCRVPGRCGRCIIQGMDDVGSEWCCRKVAGAWLPPTLGGGGLRWVRAEQRKKNLSFIAVKS